MPRTPGDWKFDPFAQGFIIVERPEDGRDLYLAEIVDEDDEGLFEPDEKKRLANGRLMAAAPELLDALEMLLEWSQQLGGWEAPAWIKAQEAIKEARGE